MILLDGSLQFGFMGVATENKAIKAYFEGTYFRSVPAMVIDRSNGTSSIGVLYICAKNVLFLLQATARTGQLFKLQSSDRLKAVDPDSELLRRAINGQTLMQTFTQFKTTHPINFLELDNRYLFAVDILTPIEGNIGATFSSAMFVVAKDYIARNANLINAVSAVLHNREFDFTLPLPGNDMQKSELQRNWQFIVLFLLIMLGAMALMFFVSKDGIVSGH